VNSNGATIRIASSELLSGIRVLNSDETRQLDNGFHDFEGEFVATVFQKTTIAGIEGYKPLLIDVISRLTLENLSEDEVNDIRTHGIELVYIGTSQSLDNAAEEFLACESLKNVVTLKVLASVGTAKAILALANLYTSGLYGFHRNADTAHSLKAFVQQLAFEPNPN
jgi:hypothetical protein